ncbi:hypothetical protein AcV5_004907 [Taiwanofungus camphoratus]|nr:hypothetical protein AcW2_010270 [Antrodia cinnamomea]KAI0936876.1 hypothetical protein AcV5_004907 [Antrodia cinnamomea]
MHCHYANVREPCNKQLQSEDNPIKPHWTKSPRQTRYFLQPSCLMISVSDTRRGIDFDKGFVWMNATGLERGRLDITVIMRLEGLSKPNKLGRVFICRLVSMKEYNT